MFASFAAAIWFIFGDADRRSALAGIGFTGASRLFGLAMSGSLLIAGSWATVAGAHTGARDAFIEYLVYQPAKYIPGGVAQGFLQVSHLRAAIGSWQRSSGVFGVHMLVLAAGGGLVGIPAFADQFSVGFVAIASAVAVGTALIVIRLSDRFAFSKEVVPPISRVAIAVALAGAGLSLWGVGYGLTIAPLSGEKFHLIDVSRFAAGWLSGFLAVPIPAGLGVREAVLIAVSAYPAPTVITGSVVVRVVVAAAEALLALAILMVQRLR